jgi:tetratricopeptide (TPR) repeat protein
VYYKRAYAYFNLEKYDNALQDINSYLKKNQTDLQAVLLRANVYVQRSQWANAIGDINTLMAANPNPELLRWRASVALQGGEYHRAQRDIEELLLHEEDAELQSYLGLCYYYQNKQDSALQVFNTVIQKHPQLIETYIYAGSLCLEAGEYEQALFYINKGLAVSPTNETLLYYKGAALVENPKTVDEGCRCLMKAFTSGMDDAAEYLKEYCFGTE